MQLAYATAALILACGLWASVDACKTIEKRFKFDNSDVYVRLRRGPKLQYEVLRGSRSLQTITLDNFESNGNFEATSTGSYKLSDGKTTIEFTLVKSTNGVTHLHVARDQVLKGTQPRDCVPLHTGRVHWFGGAEQKQHYWPVERQQYSNFSYLPKELGNMGVAERYWLNSEGFFLYVDNTTPLFIDQNAPGLENHLCVSALISLPYDPRLSTAKFSYQLVFAKDAKVAHMYAVKTLFGKPTGHPDERMVQHPVWSTWALYKAEVDDTVVRDFAKQILDNGFENSQLEIDDDWEDCYGALTFRKNKFPNAKLLSDDLKALGFRVTLWIHPFINNNCTAIYETAKAAGYLVLDHAGSPDTKWWNSKPNDAAYLDFTKPAVRDWFTTRLKRLQAEDGIDSFKFDAGESSWIPTDAVLQGDANLTPLQIITDYVRTVAEFGDMIEVRSGQNTQDLPVFVRIVDKDSEWGWNNGLVTLITSLMQMNLNGYPFVLPDMIGGNGYNEKPPTKELFLRWLQANVFMPSIQFSYVPWYFNDSETIEISKTFTKLHSDYTPYIMKTFKRAVETGEPVNAPLWWISPNDAIAQSIYDEFLLGDDIIAAPVVVEGATNRDIYLPEGEWIDGNTNDVYKGPVWIMEYTAPLNTLPYFLRKGAELV